MPAVARSALTAFLAVLTGSGLAGLAHAVNEPCVAGAREGGDTTATLELAPLGSRCADGTFVGPGTTEWLAAIALAAVLLFLAPRLAAARGAAAAALVLAVTGWLYQYGGEYTSAVAFTLPLAAVLAWTVLRSIPAAGATVAAALTAWTILTFAGFDRLGVLAGLAAGAAVGALSARRDGRAGARPSRAARPGSTPPSTPGRSAAPQRP